MSHKDAVRLLIPLDLGGIHESLLTAEGEALDTVAADIEALRLTIITDLTTLLPADDRMTMVPAKWVITKPFYVRLAVSLGYTIYIEDRTPGMSDFLYAGDELVDQDPWEYFTAGCAMSGDFLAQEDVITPWIWGVVVVSSPEVPPSPDLETVLNDIGPAHIKLLYTYL